MVSATSCPTEIESPTGTPSNRGSVSTTFRGTLNLITANFPSPSPNTSIPPASHARQDVIARTHAGTAKKNGDRVGSSRRRKLADVGILLLLVVGVGVAVFVRLLVGALRSGRQLPGSTASDLARAEHTL